MTTDKKNSLIERLKSRWKLNTAVDVVIVLIVFALTGTTVVVIKPYVLTWITGSEELSGWVSVAYYVLILPVYNLILLIYGAIFGKFRFFWNFEIKFFRRLLGRK